MPKCAYCDMRGTASEVRAHQRAECGIDPRWAKVTELSAAGFHQSADRLVRRILKVKRKNAKPMTEAKRAELEEYKRTHKGDIARRRKDKIESERRLKAAIDEASQKLSKARR